MERRTQKLLEQVRADYLQRIERIAEELRPRFEAGELRGFNDADEAAMDSEDRRLPRAYLRTKVPTCCRLKLPRCELEKELTRRLRLRDERAACLVLAVSPSTGTIPVIGGESTWGRAETAALWDVLRIACARRWYKPHPSEIPTAKDLRLPPEGVRKWPDELLEAVAAVNAEAAKLKGRPVGRLMAVANRASRLAGACRDLELTARAEIGHRRARRRRSRFELK